MSDLKTTCPACDSWTSEVGRALRDGEPCPYCGLPAEAAETVMEARKLARSALERMARAEARAAMAEKRLGHLLGTLGAIARMADSARGGLES